jgi:hypothetical protein
VVGPPCLKIPLDELSKVLFSGEGDLLSFLSRFFKLPAITVSFKYLSIIG